MNPKKTGQRIGDWFLWIECEVTKTAQYRSVPIVTLRKAVTGGEVISTVVASREMAAELRHAADQIESVIASIEEEGKDRVA